MFWNAKSRQTTRPSRRSRAMLIAPHPRSPHSGQAYRETRPSEKSPGTLRSSRSAASVCAGSLPHPNGEMISSTNKVDSALPSTDKSRHLRPLVVDVGGRAAQPNPRVDVFAVAIVRASDFLFTCDGYHCRSDRGCAFRAGACARPGDFTPLAVQSFSLVHTRRLRKQDSVRFVMLCGRSRVLRTPRPRLLSTRPLLIATRPSLIVGMPLLRAPAFKCRRARCPGSSQGCPFSSVR